MSTVRTQAVRKGSFTRAALSAVFATLAVAGCASGEARAEVTVFLRGCAGCQRK